MKIGEDYIGVGGGVLIFNDNEEVLLLKRGTASKNEVGFWQKPGGAINFGEKVVDAMIREVLEETGLKIEIWGYLPHSDHIIKAESQHWVGFNYLARWVSGIAQIMEPDKCEKLGWFALDELPVGISQTTIEAIESYSQEKYIEI